MTTVQNSEEARRTAPYVSFSAFRKLLDRMASEGAPPGRVDRSYLHGMSGGYQAQILNAFRALDLVDADGVPTDDLRRVVANLDTELPPFIQRKVALLYPEAVELAKANGSAGQLAELFRSAFGMQGSTLEGAIRFYIDASHYSGMPVGALFRPPVRSRKGISARPKSNGRAASKRTQASAPDTSVAVSPTPTMAPMASSTQRVELASGGSIVLTMAVDLFALTEEDRTFVFDMIDRVKTYRTTSPLARTQDFLSDTTTEGAAEPNDDGEAR